ncbi:dihydrolipoyl dehydrogenase [Malacoplasma iowae]|nr:dihydrolipoyl dehydrogenase [Malacoplasma iowae]WPL41225.1 dihydrolipoyl dehydrogenase [Malacoplasma iowae]
MKKYDLIVIGSGPGGYIAAEYASKQGLSTMIVEKENFGGVCLNKGCIPTKTLLRSSKINEYIKHAIEFGVDGINLENISLNWEKIQSRKNSVISKLQMGIGGLMKMAKVDVVMGNADIVDDHTILVNGEQYSFDKLILATGSEPRKLNLPGFELGYQTKKIMTSDEALNLTSIPKKFTVIGGGVIGVEFALLYAELGSQVTILQGVDRILEVLDKDISNEITKLLLDKGIKIITDIKVLEYSDNKIVYEKDGSRQYDEADVTLVSVGRVPNVELANKLNLNIERGFIVTDEHMVTSKPHVYAIGDCTSRIMLAHTAHKNAMVAVDTILGKQNKYVPLKVPSCVYTHPEVASIGYTEEELIDKNIPYYKVKTPMSHIGKALADGSYNFGFIKLMVDKKTGEILGCHIIASTASDIIAEIALAMESESTVYELANTVHPHPTVSEAIWESAKKLLMENFKDKKWF